MNGFEDELEKGFVQGPPMEPPVEFGGQGGVNDQGVWPQRDDFGVNGVEEKEAWQQPKVFEVDEQGTWQEMWQQGNEFEGEVNDQEEGDEIGGRVNDQEVWLQGDEFGGGVNDQEVWLQGDEFGGGVNDQEVWLQGDVEYGEDMAEQVLWKELNGGVESLQRKNNAVSSKISAFLSFMHIMTLRGYLPHHSSTDM